MYMSLCAQIFAANFCTAKICHSLGPAWLSLGPARLVVCRMELLEQKRPCWRKSVSSSNWLLESSGEPHDTRESKTDRSHDNPLHIRVQHQFTIIFIPFHLFIQSWLRHTLYHGSRWCHSCDMSWKSCKSVASWPLRSTACWLCFAKPPFFSVARHRSETR